MLEIQADQVGVLLFDRLAESHHQLYSIAVTHIGESAANLSCQRQSTTISRPMIEASITFPRSAVGVSQRSNLCVVRDHECFLYFWSNQRLRVSKSGGNGSTKIRYG